MSRPALVTIPTDPSQFGPVQIKPRALLGLAMSGLSAWFDEHLKVSYSHLLTRHRTGFVFTNVHLDYAYPDIRFADAGRLTATAKVTASDSAKYLHLDVDIDTLEGTDGGARRVAAYRADLRTIAICEDMTMAGDPGLLPAWLYERFQPTEIYSPDRAAIARAATTPSGRPLDAQATITVTLTRSHCEVADQWSYPELMELLTTAREHFFLDDSIPAEIGRLAVAAPIRSMAAVFQRAMYVFDSCRIITRAYVLPDQQDTVMFGHEVHDPVHPGQCLTAWEILRPV